MNDDRLEDLLDQAAELEPSPAKVALLEEAVREADALGDDGTSYFVRMELIDAASYSGFKEKSLVAFTWCLAKFDKSPEDYDEFDLLWKFKWILDQLPYFVQVSREQIVRTQDDMERRYHDLGYSLRPVHYMRWSNFMRLGDFEQAEQHVRLWQAAPRDGLADCPACEQDKHIELMIRRHRDEEALALSVPIFAGRMKCAEIPEYTYGQIVRPLLRLGRLEEALDYHRRGYRRISKNRDFLEGIAAHLMVLVAAQDWKKAARLFERHLPWAATISDFNARFEFYSASALFLAALAEASTKSQRKWKVPNTLACHREDDTYVTAELADWFQQETSQLVARFNQRNGNDYYTELWQEHARLAGRA